MYKGFYKKMNVLFQPLTAELQVSQAMMQVERIFLVSQGTS